jgi:hypothetical protein
VASDDTIMIQSPHAEVAQAIHKSRSRSLPVWLRFLL